MLNLYTVFPAHVRIERDGGGLSTCGGKVTLDNPKQPLSLYFLYRCTQWFCTQVFLRFAEFLLLEYERNADHTLEGQIFFIPECHKRIQETLLRFPYVLTINRNSVSELSM